MPTPMTYRLWQDPNFRALSPAAQMVAAEKYIAPELQADPNYLALPLDAQRVALQKYVLQAVTFQDEQGVGARAKALMLNQLAGKKGATFNRQMYEGWTSTVQSSGVLGGLRAVFSTQDTRDNPQDRQRSLEYFQAASQMLGQEDYAQEIGALLGTVADAAAVSLVMSPATSAASKAIGIAARGGKAAVAAANAAGKAAPIVSRSLAVLGPVAAETAIETVPYLLVEEQRRLQQGQEGIFTKDAGTVLRTMGMNAAVDFLFGSALVGAGALARGGKQLFFSKDRPKLAYETEAEFQKVLSEVRAGAADPEILARMKTDQPITYDRLLQTMAIDEYLSKGVLAPETYRWNKASYLAHDLSTVVGKLDDGTYRLWDVLGDDGPTAKVYETLDDLENTLSYHAYKKWESLPVEDQDKFLSAHTGWALPRGKVLAGEEALYGATPLKEYQGKPVPPISKRPAVTLGEAQALSAQTSETITVVQAQVPLRDGVVKAANRGDLNLNRAGGPITVKQHDQPNAVFVGARMAPIEAYQAVTAKAQRAIEIDASLTMESTRASMLLDLGYDHVRLPDGSVEFFTGRNMKLITDIDTILADKVVPNAAGQVSPITVVTASSMWKGGKEALANEDLVMSSAAKALRSFSDEDLTNFTKLYAANRGADVNVKVKRYLDTPTVKVTREGNNILVEAPLIPKTLKEEADYLDALLRGIEDAVPNGTPTRAVDYWGSKFATRTQAFELPRGISDAEWAREMAPRMGGTFGTVNGKPTLSVPSGSYVFATDKDAVTFISRKLADPSLVKLDLEHQGIRLTNTKAGIRATAIRDGRLLATAPTMEAILERLDYSPAFLDLSYGPKVVSIGDGFIEFSVSGNLKYNTPADAFQAMQKFKDTRLLTQKKVLSAQATATLSEIPGSRYEVFLSEYGVRKEFDNLAAARDFMRRQDALEIRELRSLMQDKWGDLYISNGQYVVTIGPSRYTARNLDELKGIMKKVPDITESAPRILDEIDPTIESNVADIVNQFKLRQKYKAGPNPYGLAPEPEFNPAPKLDAYDVGRSAFANFTAWTEDISRKYQMPELARSMARLRDGKRLADIATTQANKALRTVFTGSGGKLLPVESRTRIFYHLVAQNAEDAAALGAQYQRRYGSVLKPLTQEEEVAADHLKRFLAAAGDRFGIAYEKLIFNYMPKLRDLTDSMNAGILQHLTTGDDLLRNLPNYQPPKEIKFWAEHERLDEITRYFLKDDALEVVQLYMAQGSKKAYMNEPWKDLYRYMQSARLGEDITTRINAFRMDVMSSYHTPAEKTVEQFGAAFFRGMKKIPGVGKLIPFSEQEMEKMGKGILNHFLSLIYFSSMGWKPFLAIRNSMQPFTMTAPRVGVDWVMRAFDDVLKNGDTTYARLSRKGILSEKPPIVGSPFSQDNLLGRVAEKSMSAFKRSDDLTRAVAYRAGEMRFDNATGLWDSGKITTRATFESAAGLDVMDDTTREEAWRLFSSGDPAQRDAAKDLYANKLQRDSMFDYSGSDAPMIHKGVIGRLFGQFGSYSAGYRANIANMFKYGSPAKRAEMVATYLAMTGLLYAGFEALRIKTNDFIPFAPIFFGGGPAADLTWNAIKATGTGYEAEQARAALARDSTILIPGSTQFKYAQKALAYADQGDNYGAFLSLMGTSVKPLW